MRPNDAKFSLFIKADENTEYKVDPPADIEIVGNQKKYSWTYDPKKVFVVKVCLITSGPNPLIISNLKADDLDLPDIDFFGSYITKTSNIKLKTHGWMSETGTYTFKIRFAPLIHKFVSYIAKQTKKDLFNAAG